VSHILVVDDHPENVYFLEVLLKANGFQVSTARHGAEALVIARRDPPALVISDLLMPVMDGFTLLRHWKADDRLKASPFVVYTATYTEADDEKLARHLGADAFIVKPAEPDLIIQRVRNLLEPSSAASPAQLREPSAGDTELLEEYSAVLIGKLEHKTLQLEAANHALRQEIVEREHASNEKQRLTNDLRERVKELRLLNEAAGLLRDDFTPFGDVLEQLAASLPNAFRFPEIASVRLRFDDREQCSPDFAETAWMIRREFTVPDGRPGTVEVAYLQPAPTGELHPFLAEEHNMVTSLIDMLRSCAQRRAANEARERLAEQLREERASLVFAQRVAKVGSWEVDLRTGDALWSDELSRIIERQIELTPPGRPTRDLFMEAVHPDDRATVLAAFAPISVRPEPHLLDHRLLMPDGRVKYVKQRWQLPLDASGVGRRAIGTCQDVTDSVLAGHEIGRQQALLQAVADGTSDALFVKDLEGRYLPLNAAASQYAGKPVQEVLGHDDCELFGPVEAESIMLNDQLVISTGKVLTAEEVLTGSGVARTYLATKAPYRDTAGNVLGVLGISRDVTERKAAEVLLRENEARYRTTALQLSNVLDHSLDLICAFDSEGRFVRVSAACEHMLGCTPEELLGTRYLDMVMPEDHAKTLQASADERAGVPARNFENRYVRKDGGVRNIQWAARWSEEEQTMFCVGRDVTEHKQLEAQFLRAQRMESIGTLAGGIAHDFNNILAPIALSIELLRVDDGDPMRDEVLSTIERSARRGADMVQQLLSFARGVERDQVTNQLRHLIRDVEQILDETFLKTIDVQTDVADDLWPVQGDPTQLHQVLMNLAVNARDAMPAGGQLTITAHNVVLDGHQASLHAGAVAGPYVRVQVIDTGTGMSGEVLDRAFEPFFTTKEIGRGTGLGLSTSQGIVRSHGGVMEVTSEMGTGTTVVIYLPASPDAFVELLADTAPQLPRGKGQLVMVVDDEDALRNVAGRALEAFGYRVLLAGDGREAIELFGTHHAEIAAVVTDMMMPNVDGSTLIAALRALDPTVCIAVASGVNTPTLVSEAQRLRVEHWISKPYSAETLLVTLKEMLPD